MNNLITILKGGRGSGDFGHVGRAGKRGGSGGGGGKGRPRKGRRSREALDKEIERNKKKEEKTRITIKKSERKANVSGRDKKMLTVYHGTSSDVVDSILKEGLRITPSQDPEVPAGVYFTKKERTAQEYGTMLSGDDEKFAVVEFNIPNKDKIHVDLYDKKWYKATDSFYYEDAIPPQWIKAVYVHEWIDGEGYVKVKTTTKQGNDAGISFSVIGIDDSSVNNMLKHVCHVLRMSHD